MPHSGSELHQGIDAGELRLHYQPLVGAHSRLGIGVEALVRWQHSTRGLLGPDLFLPAMERNNLLGGLTDWVVDEALGQCRAWQQDGYTVPVSVNVSATLLTDLEFPRRLGVALDKHQVAPHLLTAEVTETALAAHPQVAAGVVTALRAAGIRVSVDDFGTGYTSLGMLKDHTFDEIKIDRSFIAAIRHSPSDAAIVRAVLELGHRLGAEVVAEGVEDEATARLLAELGCDTLQGFYFAKPAPAPDTLAVLRERGTKKRFNAAALYSATPQPAVPQTSNAPGGSVPALPPLNEAERLSALARLNVLDTEPDAVLDDLVSIAAAICGTETALLSFVDRDRQWFKAKLNMDPSQTPRDMAFCAHAILDPDEVMEVPDTHADERFATNPLVTEDPHIRYYAGAPLISDTGHALGTLCVLDRRPHTMSAGQRAALETLSRMAIGYLDARRTETVMHRLRDVQNVLSVMHERIDIPAAADIIAVAARELLHADGAVLVQADGPGSVIYRPIGVSANTPARTETAGRVVLDSRTDSPTAAAVQTREAVYLADVTDANGLAANTADELDAASALYVPVTGKTGVAAVLAAWWSTPQPPTLAPSVSAAATMLAAETGTTLARIHALSELRQAAETDHLTGLLNRRAFLSALQHADTDTALIMVDLDHFKRINDTGGHQAGDQALKSFAAHLRAAARTNDLVARWGGEEFILALPTGSLEGAQSLLTRLRASWDTPEAPATFSAGYATIDPDETPLAALNRADKALYTAKRAGRNRDHKARRQRTTLANSRRTSVVDRHPTKT